MARRGTYDAELLDAIKRVQFLEGSLAEIHSRASAEERLRRDRVNDQHFWIGLLIPTGVSIVAAVGSAIVTIIYKK